MDKKNLFLGNTGYIIPGGDYFLLGVLSSWATWFFISKTAQPLRLRSERWQYRLIAQFMAPVPIPKANAGDKKAIGDLARMCSELAEKRYRLGSAFQHRMTQTFRTMKKGEAVGKLNEKAQDWPARTFRELGDSLKTSFKLPMNPFSNPRLADEWEKYFQENKFEHDLLGRQMADAEADLNDRVYRLFDLTPAEIQLLKREVEH